MIKSTFFTGQPIFNQVLSFIPRSLVNTISRAHKADRYCKRFGTYEHLVTMLYGVFNNCTSLREVSTGMLAWDQRIKHLGINHHSRRSTISDANNRRKEAVFGAIYKELLSRYSGLLSDSRLSSRFRKLYIIDSTTVTLFSEVLRGTGLVNHNGKRKGGVKVHTVIRSDQDVPDMIRFSEAKSNDAQFLKQVKLPEGSVIVFDKGYPDYKSYNRFTSEKVSWITRLRKRTVYKKIKGRAVDKKYAELGILSDTEVMLGNHHHKTAVKVRARLIRYKEPQTKKEFEFLTNNQRLSPLTVANYYKKRWQIELLFKRLKQNFPLKYFLGDSENAIKIQIWCVLIADLLLKIIKKGSSSKMSFSNLASLVRLHLMTYMSLSAFLKAPEKELINRLKNSPPQNNLPSLFPT